MHACTCTLLMWRSQALSKQVCWQCRNIQKSPNFGKVITLIISTGVQCAHCLNVEYLPSEIGQSSRTIIHFVPNFRRTNINYGIRIPFIRTIIYLTHRAVYHNDIVLICSEPGIHCTTNINKLLQVRHMAVRPGEIINLLEEGERERGEGKQRGASWVRVVIYYTLGR